MLKEEDFQNISSWFDLAVNFGLEGLDPKDAEELRAGWIETAQKIHDMRSEFNSPFPPTRKTLW